MAELLKKRFLWVYSMPNHGMMSDVDILEAMENGELCITPFEPDDKQDKRLTPVGFNFSFSNFVVSLNHKKFFKIYKEPVEGFSV